MFSFLLFRQSFTLQTKKTKVPPPVKTKPVVFATDKSELNSVTVVKRPASAIELSSSPVVSEAGQPVNTDESNKFSIPEVATSTVVFDSSAPTEKKTSSGKLFSLLWSHFIWKLNLYENCSIVKCHVYFPAVLFLNILRTTLKARLTELLFLVLLDSHGKWLNEIETLNDIIWAWCAISILFVLFFSTYN